MRRIRCAYDRGLFMRWQRATRPFSSAFQIRLFRLFQGSAFEKVRRRSATNRIRARARDHAANHVAPARKKFSIARVPSRRSMPTPTFAPSAAMNSVAARRLRSLPLIYMIPETINTCRAVRTGKSAKGIGCAPIAAQIAVVDFINICAT